MARRALRKRETFRMYRIIVLWLSDSKKRAEGWDPITDRSKQALKKQSV